MPNVAAVLKEEVTRIARKEFKQHLHVLQKSAAAHRRELAGLKRRVQELERELGRAGRSARPQPKPAAAPQEASRIRFSPRGFASLRRRLGLSAEDFGALIGASGLSVYKWEHGKVTPRAKFLQAIAAIRGIGKREAARRLESLK